MTQDLLTREENAKRLASKSRSRGNMPKSVMTPQISWFEAYDIANEIVNKYCDLDGEEWRCAVHGIEELLMGNSPWQKTITTQPPQDILTRKEIEIYLHRNTQSKTAVKLCNMALAYLDTLADSKTPQRKSYVGHPEQCICYRCEKIRANPLREG